MGVIASTAPLLMVTQLRGGARVWNWWCKIYSSKKICCIFLSFPTKFCLKDAIFQKSTVHLHWPSIPPYTPPLQLHSKSFYLWWMRTSTSNTISSAQREFSITQIVVTADGHSQLPFRGRLLSNCISLHDLRGCRGWERHCSNCRFGHQPRYNRRSDLYQAKREKIGRLHIF